MAGAVFSFVDFWQETICCHTQMSRAILAILALAYRAKQSHLDKASIANIT